MKIENPDEIIYIERAVPEWRNWQTRWTQNPVPGDRGEGSIPSSGTSFPLIYNRFPSGSHATVHLGDIRPGLDEADLFHRFCGWMTAVLPA